MKIVELREYKIKPGKTKEWLNWMKAELIPYQKSKGMKIIDTYIHTGADGNDYFIWLREFDNEESRMKIHGLTYNDWWIKEIRPKVFKLIDENSITVKLVQQVDL
ncbi:NIPSNAP family protein [Thalassotalea piscium]